MTKAPTKPLRTVLGLGLLVAVACFWYFVTQRPMTQALARCRAAYAAARSQRDSELVDAMVDTVPQPSRIHRQQSLIMYCDHREVRGGQPHQRAS